MSFESKISQFLLEGYTQLEISQQLKSADIRPNSLSAIEKEIKRIKEKHNAKTMCHLGAILMFKKHINNE